MASRKYAAGLVREDFMRVIKFRAWDSLHNVYREHQDPQTIQAVVFGNDYDGRVIVEQFTGLLDKNGKEIYEGDILQRGNCKKIVGFVAEAAGFKMYNVVDKPHEEEWDIWQTMSQSWVDEFGAEIVGNIHQS